jgi:hypothetical protein
MTANEFYRCCALGYAANQYEWTNLSPKEQYQKHADGRDDGLSNIDGDSQEAFLCWLNDRKSHIGHPWEVCRGGNSTHISLYVQHDQNGFHLILAGDAYTRTIETVKFYLALRHAGYPVYVMEGKTLAKRLLGTERMGIVPEGVFPAYCTSYFPNEHIIDFANLPDEERQALAQYCVWQPIPEVKLASTADQAGN